MSGACPKDSDSLASTGIEDDLVTDEERIPAIATVSEPTAMTSATAEILKRVRFGPSADGDNAPDRRVKDSYKSQGEISFSNAGQSSVTPTRAATAIRRLEAGAIPRTTTGCPRNSSA